MEVPQTVSEFFTWLASAGALGFVVSAIAEVFPKWEMIDPKVKRWIVLGISAVLGLLSAALVRYVPAGVVEGAQDWYKAIVTAIAIFAASQWSHWAIIKREDRIDPLPDTTATMTDGSTEVWREVRTGTTARTSDLSLVGLEPPVATGNG